MARLCRLHGWRDKEAGPACGLRVLHGGLLQPLQQDSPVACHGSGDVGTGSSCALRAGPRSSQRAEPCRGRWSSRPGEFHPGALSEPYLTVSRHTAPPVQPAWDRDQCPIPGFPHHSPGDGKLLCPVHRSSPVAGCSHVRDRTGTPLRSSVITTPSALLQTSPSPCPASVLSRSWGLHLRFSLRIGTTGSHVP